MEYTVKVHENGKISIPAELRRKWNLEAGQELILKEDGDVAILTKQKSVIYALKQEIKAKLPEGISFVEQLREERRRDAVQQ
ncbi:looped-hinge helix DNA binding domain, AbrB family [Xenococcus sp. PCC 7305]|uniref:AbrB/MazE/SpoVT family DNA-binding domain-containing protein n=1 Tax=Xenococcus sp. PCC 7305 TaxID=102125 RepID=UPI0002ABC0D2|nr:AbrB/MazE/SpoVT family DNA-binding domain-containing protein [Xenococcus sp. PCC 7305]ELS03618.1 looped-hinge helix DNA binding domain, AbrB family [Xenococcus sp. PCC 7305]